MSLRELQRDFCAFLREDGSVPLSGIAPQAQRGLAVYHYAHRATLHAALRDVFERTHGWLGDARFESAAAHHIACHPPVSWTLAAYGAGFHGTLAALYPDHPEVAELAWLDWSLRAAFNGPDSPALDLAGLAGLDWETARLTINPTLACRAVATNVALIWQALDDDEAPPPAEPLPLPAMLSVWRHDLMPRFQTIERREYDALIEARDGASFGKICTGLATACATPETAAASAGAMLGRWISEGLLVGIA